MIDGNKSIARINTHRNRRNGKRSRKLRRKVLQTMHRKVDPVIKKRLFDLLGKHALRSHLVEGHILQGIARCANDLNADLMPGTAQRVGNMVRLPERQLRAARADTDHERSLRLPTETGSSAFAAEGCAARGFTCSCDGGRLKTVRITSSSTVSASSAAALIACIGM